MNWLFELDGTILLWIQEHIRNARWDKAVIFITDLGNAGWFWLAVCALLFLLPSCRKVGLAGFAALFIGFLITNLCLKNMVARIRPYELVEGLTYIGKRPSDFSFPSGHATCSMAASVVLFVKLPKKYGIAALVLGIAICLSRLYVGVHYPTDVLAGMAIGTVSAFLALYLLREKKENVGIS